MARAAAEGTWWDLAACSSADPDLFFPISASGPALAQVMRAKAVCATCRVRPQCLQFALAEGPMEGIWGGATEEERRVIVAHHSASPRPSRSVAAVPA